MKILSRFFLLFFFSLLFISCKKNKTNILPGKGIVYNGNTILLNNTTAKELAEFLAIDDNTPVTFVEAECYDEEGNSFNCGHYTKSIQYAGMTFDFGGTTEDSLQLNWINLPIDPNHSVFINDTLLIDPHFNQVPLYFPKQTKYDHLADNEMGYDLYSYGLSFRYDSVKEERLLKEISVHYRITE